LTFDLAYELGYSIETVEAMTPERFTDWIAYFAVQGEKKKAAERRNGSGKR